MRAHRIIFVSFVAVLAADAATAREPVSDEARIAAAASGGVRLIQQAQAGWKIPCLSCHHQGLGFMALGVARQHGIAVDEKAAYEHASKTLGQIGGFDGIVSMPLDPFAHGYVMMAASAEGVAPNLSTAIVARRFANAQQPDGHWAPNDGRPPHSASTFTSTALAVRSMALYLPPQRAAERDRAFARARRWFMIAEPDSTEDRAFRLLGLTWASAGPVDRAATAADLLGMQRTDGGWSQVPQMDSDAYATGEALFALAESGIVHPDEPAFRAGIGFLMRTQQPQGSWHVRTRLHSTAQISPPFFDAGFPNGKDQFISFAGTAWAIMALSKALPEATHPAAPLPLPQAGPKGVQPWMDIAVSGSVDELRSALDGGLDPNSSTPGGTTLLNLSIPDTAKVKLLLERGAKPSGSTLTTAATYAQTAPIVRMLIERGIPASREVLFEAVSGGDVEVARVLLEHGAGRRAASNGHNSPMASAALLGNADMIRLLASDRDEVNQPDGDGMTPLMTAAVLHRTEAVRALIEVGADPYAKDKHGLTALQHAGDIWYADPKTQEVLSAAHVP